MRKTLEAKFEKCNGCRYFSPDDSLAERGVCTTYICIRNIKPKTKCDSCNYTCKGKLNNCYKESYASHRYDGDHRDLTVIKVGCTGSHPSVRYITSTEFALDEDRKKWTQQTKYVNCSYNFYDKATGEYLPHNEEEAAEIAATRKAIEEAQNAKGFPVFKTAKGKPYRGEADRRFYSTFVGKCPLIIGATFLLSIFTDARALTWIMALAYIAYGIWRQMSLETFEEYDKNKMKNQWADGNFYDR